MKKSKQTRAEDMAKEWENYMSTKIRKLENQFENVSDFALKNHTVVSSIFKDIAIFVNGYTMPTADELKQLMLLHGGTYHHYYSKSKTTHIVASNLAAATLRNIPTNKVVRPEWIVESIKVGYLLPYHQFILPQINQKQSLLFSNSKLTQVNEKHRSANYLGQSIADDTEDVTAQVQSSNPVIELNDNVTKGTLGNIDAASLAGSSRTMAKNSGTSLLSKSGAAMCATDSGFLTEFYSHSRLHLISTMGATFKEYVSKLQEKDDGKFPGRQRILLKLSEMNGEQKPLPIDKKVIMHIDMDCFFVSVGLRNKPELKGKPVAVTHSKGKASGNKNNIALWNFEREYYYGRKDILSMDLDLSNEQEINNRSMEEENGSNSVQRRLVQSKEQEQFKSTSEIACCNYEARKAGLRNGMFLGGALELCPDLCTIPYDFDGYKEVAYTLYDVLASYTHDIEAVSCDELYADCTAIVQESNCDPLMLASIIRQEIEEKTQCTCSAGLAPNMLLARLATKKAKPNGQVWIDSKSAKEFVSQFLVRDLPGVGRTVSNRLNAMEVITCADLQKLSLGTLQKEFGPKTGQTLHDFCYGKDGRSMKSENLRKSVSAEVNYGIRFTSHPEAEKFLAELSEEVSKRLLKLGMKGRNISLKLKVRKKEVPKETAKFLGHGICDNITRSVSLLTATNSSQVIGNEVGTLFRGMNVVPSDLRGIGIQVQRLESINKKTTDSGKTLFDFVKKKEHQPSSNSATNSISATATSFNSTVDQQMLPSLSQLDQSVLKELPLEIQDQIRLEYQENEQYKKSIEAGESSAFDQSSESNESFKNRCQAAQIDEEVLKALPKEIQEEVKEVYKLEKKVVLKTSPEKQMKRRSPKGKANRPGHKINPLKRVKKLDTHSAVLSTESSENVRTSPCKADSPIKKQKAQLCGALHLDDVKSLIQEWISSCEEPEDDDVKMLSNYLKALVMEKNLEKVDLVVKYLNRSIIKKPGTSWKISYDIIIDDLQDLMRNIYGAPLKTPKC